MGPRQSDASRRALLRLAATVPAVGLAGCVTIGERDGDVQLEDMRSVPEGDDNGRIQRPALDEPVPEVEATCTSIDGVERDPDDLDPKDQVAYQEFPSGYQLCANCRFFCPSETADPVGACTEVEGRIGSQHWCALWVPLEGADRDPNPTSSGTE